MVVKFAEKLRWVTVAAGLLLTGCVTDVYEPPHPGPNENGSGISDNFDGETSSSVHLQVKVPDLFEGKYYYTVEVYTEDPAISDDARLITGGKCNSATPFEDAVLIPKVLKYVVIVVTDPTGSKSTYNFDVKEGDMVLDLNEITDTKAASNSMAGIASPSVPKIVIDRTELEKATVLDKKNTEIKSGGVYKITQDLDSKITFPGDYNFTLYVDDAEWTVNQDLILQQASRLYILNGGSLEKGNGNGKITVNHNALIYVDSESEIEDGEGDDKNGFAVTLINNGQLINAGGVVLKSLYWDGGGKAAVYNTGELDVLNDITQTTDGNLLVNDGKMEAGNVTLNNGELYNGCLFKVKNNFKVSSNTLIVLQPYAYTSCKKLMMGENNEMFIDAFSMFVCSGSEGAHFNYNNRISGSTIPEEGLFRTTKIVANWGGVYFSRHLQVEVPDKMYPSADNCRFISPAVRKSEATVVIEKGDCNEKGNTPEKGDITEDSQVPDYTEKDPIEYVYMFEDNWPIVGDYDMNDVVLSIKIANNKKGSQTQSFSYTATVYALGGTVPVGAAFQLKDMPAANVQGAEAGQKYAVFKIGGELHALFNVATDEMVNSYKLEYEPQVMKGTVTFNTPVKGSINPDVLDLFIYRGNWDDAIRAEIHLPGAAGTDKAKKSETSVDYKYRGEENEFYNMMWGLRLPITSFAYYAKERIAIKEAFPSFQMWATGSQDGISENADWYLKPDNGKILKLEEGK